MLEIRRKSKKRSNLQIQLTAKIANVTLRLVSFLRSEKYQKNASKSIQRLGLRPISQNYQKAKKDTIWYLFSQIGIFFSAKSHPNFPAENIKCEDQSSKLLLQV